MIELIDVWKGFGEDALNSALNWGMKDKKGWKLINARKVSLSLEYPKGKQPPTLAMKFEESQDGVKA